MNKSNQKIEEFDLIVIGTGSGGSGVAHRCRQAGWSVAIIDELPFGGTCALRGCDPKKVLVGAADLVDWHSRMQAAGVVAGNSKIDWGALMNFKRTFTDPVPQNREESYQQAGIKIFHGSAQFVDKTTVQIGDRLLRGRFVHIAVGAKPSKLGIEGEEHLTDSTAFLELTSLPERIVFVGGGYISMEFAHVAIRAGANVTVLHRGKRLLEGFDADLAEKLTVASKEAGIDVVLGAAVEAVEKKDKGFAVRVSSGDKKHFLDADLVVHGAGRTPHVDELNLEAGGVKSERRGIAVNEYLQSVSNPAVYAAGDVAASEGLPLTPIAGLDAETVAKNLIEGNKYKPDYTVTPTVVFTLPSLASVGLLEDQAREKGLKFHVNFQDVSAWYSSRRINQKYAASKVLVEEGSDKILGAHIMGHNAEEIINIFALAMRSGLTAKDLKSTIWAYPTNASDIPYMV